MSVRWQTLVACTVTCCLAGCGGGESSKARFAENTELAKPLLRKARTKVQETVIENFGTPLDCVAWLKLLPAVNYGKAEGTIKSVNGQNLAVEFNAETSDLESLKSPELSRSGLLFTSGANQDTSVLLASYDASAKLLVTLEALKTVPAAGDQFVVAGHILRHGRKLYARHCQHCHGVSGDGNGPTAHYLNPKPRDYRKGLFKFTSTPRKSKATRDDLRRIIAAGLPGTYMPAFVPMLKDHELVAIVEYVRWLAMRGEIERALLVELNGDYSKAAVKDVAESSKTKESKVQEQVEVQLEKYLKDEYPGLVNELASDLAEKWISVEVEGVVIVPKKPRTPDSAESRANGKKLFLGDKAKCVNCHGPAGRGNGVMTEDFLTNDETKQRNPDRGLFDEWGNAQKPRDLTRGIYRGGRRPLDIYRRVAVGIKGTQMPGSATSLTEEEMWDLVNYVLSIPFESSAPKVKPQSVAVNPSGHEHAN